MEEKTLLKINFQTLINVIFLGHSSIKKKEKKSLSTEYVNYMNVSKTFASNIMLGPVSQSSNKNSMKELTKIAQK